MGVPITRTLPRNAQKKAIIFRLSLCVERKTRLEPTLRVGNSRELYLHPLPLKGAYGVAPSNLIILKSKRLAKCQPFDFERKTRLELATPTLARLCSTN